ncbi:MAG: NUDIX domain-containing protein [Isosphaeraceae bacterium]
MGEPRRVGIGLVTLGGRFLVRQRTAPPLEGFWEFPGGKCEPGESPRDSAARECREELGFAVILADEPRRVVMHDYPHGRLELHFFDGRPESPGSVPSPETGFRWVIAADLPALRFPEANAAILDDLADPGT